MAADARPSMPPARGGLAGVQHGRLRRSTPVAGPVRLRAACRWKAQPPPHHRQSPAQLVSSRFPRKEKRVPEPSVVRGLDPAWCRPLSPRRRQGRDLGVIRGAASQRELVRVVSKSRHRQGLASERLQRYRVALITASGGYRVPSQSSCRCSSLCRRRRPCWCRTAGRKSWPRSTAPCCRPW
jgi:hypothetical protein